MRINKTLVNVLGCVPGVGTVIGVVRIIGELQKIRQLRVHNTTLSFFAALNECNSGKKIFRGVCEIIPVAGPLAYGAVKLYQACARKVNAKATKNLVVKPKDFILLSPTPPVSPKTLPQPTSACTPSPMPEVPKVLPPPADLIPLEHNDAINLANIDSCETLRQHVGKKIKINFEYHARADSNQKTKYPFPQRYVGVLHSVSDEIDKKYTIQLNDISFVSPERLKVNAMTFTVSNAELQSANRRQ
jgi:hypothetical protein